MKRKIINCLVVFLSCFIIASCNNSDDEPIPSFRSYFDGDYSHGSETEHLDLYVNNTLVTDKPVSLTCDPENGIINMVLRDIVPGYKTVNIENIPLVFDDESETILGNFQGKLKISSTTTISYDGYLEIAAAFSMYKVLRLNLIVENHN